jgi:hypothetical protein
MELFKNIAEMAEVFKPNILHPKVINNETGLDGMPFVVPEARGGFGFVKSFSKKAGLEEIIGKNASLGKAITALVNFKVNLIVMLATFKVVFLNEFCQNVCNFNADIFRVGHWGIKVEVFEVDGAKMCTWAREQAVEKQLDKFKGCGVGSHITQEADGIATDGDGGVIGIILFRLRFTYHHGVADFFFVHRMECCDSLSERRC